MVSALIFLNTARYSQPFVRGVTHSQQSLYGSIESKSSPACGRPSTALAGISMMIGSFVRKNTLNRFGPVREVIHSEDAGMVFEVAFEGLQRSTRHKSGVAMRFPRISRLRWDKPPREADTLETVMALLPESERA